MKRNYFLAATAAAVLALTSCAKSDVIDSMSTTCEVTPINFGTFLGKAAYSSAAASPKGAVLTLEDIKKSSKITVAAYHTGTSTWSSYSPPAAPNFMSDCVIAWDGTLNEWKYTPLKYWPKESDGSWGKVSFFGYSPASSCNTSGKAGSAPMLTFTAEQQVEKQVDLVAATVIDAANDVNSGKVKFEFDHILSRIGFTVKLATAYPDFYVKINQLKIYYKQDKVLREGVYTYNASNNCAAANWNQTSPPIFFKADGGVMYVGNDTLSSQYFIDLNIKSFNSRDCYMMLIPQVLSDDDIYAELQYESIAIHTNTKTSNTLKIGLPAITLQPGLAYTYNLNLNLKLNSVAFDTDIDVNAWPNSNSNSITLNIN